MENYTLNRFYYEAKALLEKYTLQGKKDYKLTVEFKINQHENKAPKLDCVIRYEPKKYDTKEPSYYGFGCTPVICIDAFEETLQKATGIQLLDNVAVELTE